MAEIFICERGQLDTATKRALKKVGVVAVEVDDVAKCQFVKAGEIVSYDDMVWALLDALNHSSDTFSSSGVKQREQLTKNLLKIVVDRRRDTTDA